LHTWHEQRAIKYDSERDPRFGDDSGVSDNCNANTRSVTFLGDASANDTGLAEDIVFTGSPYFQVKGIEIRD
jgi:hypothetical protein